MKSYLVLTITTHETRGGKPFWRMQLRPEDALNNVIDGIAWSEGVASFGGTPPEAGSVIDVRDADTGEYGGRPQLTLKSFNASMLLDASHFRTPPVVDVAECVSLIWRSGDSDIIMLFDAITSEMESDGSWARYLEVPGGARNHHAVRAGLLQHTMEMIEIAETLLGNIEWLRDVVDHAILRAAIVLHDLGKTHEYDAETLTFSADDHGKLLGHPAWAVVAIERHWPREGNQSRKLRLQHAVMCHHGRSLSPVAPVTPEASLINFIDGISATMSVYRDKPLEHSSMLGGTPVFTKQQGACE